MIFFTLFVGLSNDPFGFGIIIGFWMAIGLIPVFILYRYIIKHFNTKHIFITEIVLTVLFSIAILVGYLAENRHLIIDLRNYSENYYLIISGYGEQKEMDTRPSTFLINYVGVLYENYFFLSKYNFHDDDTEIIYPTSWQLSVEDSRKQENFRRLTDLGELAHQNFILSGPFTVEIYYNNAFDYSSRTLDSLATLVVYARQENISLFQANEALATIWTEMDYMYTTILEPYVKNSKATKFFHETDFKYWEDYNRAIEEDKNAPPSDYGIHLSYTSYECIIDDLMRRANLQNWSEKTINELTEYYTNRMPFGFFRLHVERETEDQANSNNFGIDSDYYSDNYLSLDYLYKRLMTSNPAEPYTRSDSTTWTNTIIIRETQRPDSTFQVTIFERYTDRWGEGKIPFTFDMKRN